MSGVMLRAPVLRWAVAACAIVVVGSVEAHVETATVDDTPSIAALLEVTLPAVLSAGLYVAGYGRCTGWRISRGGRSDIRAWRAAGFFIGLAALTASLISPLDRWSATSFAFHMTQHEILMLIAAPLLVLGRPLPYFLWALSAGARERVGRLVALPVIKRSWNTLLNPMVAWTLHALALWLWHAPALFDAALDNRLVHDLQHLSFLATALIFWAALFEERNRERQGAAVLFLFTTTIHTGVLGALLTFATHPWYSTYLSTPPALGLSPLEDQQLGGLIMWVPASLVYVGAGLALLARWIRASDFATR
jgi:putative membrane protein